MLLWQFNDLNISFLISFYFAFLILTFMQIEFMNVHCVMLSIPNFQISNLVLWQHGSHILPTYFTVGAQFGET